MFERIAGLFQSGQPEPALIAALDLQDWYEGLTAEERQKLHEYSTFFGTGEEMNLLDWNVTDTSQSAQKYLEGVGSTAASEKDYEFAEKVFWQRLIVRTGRRRALISRTIR